MCIHTHAFLVGKKDGKGQRKKYINGYMAYFVKE
jgi:hypothetical protein